MATASSLSFPAFTEKTIALLSMDVSSARYGWFVIPSGIDMKDWQVVFNNGDEDIAESPVLERNNELDFKPLTNPVVAFTPRTELGKRLWEIRKRIVASGTPLLDWDGVSQEVADRRGERG